MLDRRRLARHGRGAALLFLVAFLALALATYDRGDPPGADALPTNDPARNLCGPSGAWLAHALYQSVGLASYGVVMALAVVDLLIFRRRAVPDRLHAAIGFALLMAVASTAMQRLAPGLGNSAPIGSGGHLGALGVALLGGNFGAAGMALILLGAGVVGLAMARDVLFVWPARELASVFRRPRAEAVAPIAAHRDFLPMPVERPSYPESLPALARTPGTPAAIPPRGQPQGTAIVREPRAPVPAYTPPSDGRFVLPPRSLLESPAAFPVHEHEARVHERALLLEKTLREHGCIVRVVQIDTGPVITQFEIELEAGLRVSRIVSLSNDLAIALAVPSVRIVSPIPGKTTVGIEVPNERRGMVKLGEVVDGVNIGSGKLRIPLFLGKDVKGVPLAFDLADMPHLLIAGRTGTGKSVCLNAMILSILMTKTPDEVKLLLIDPKMVELSQFKRIPHLMHPVVTDMKKAEALLSWACDKMDERYGFLARAGVRNIQTYNQLGPDEILARVQPESDEDAARIPMYMPYIVIIADEMADLMMTAAKEVESHIVRLAQKARAVGMHLIVATQKPTVDVITGLIKGNLPARIAFQVASRGDSRVVLDEMGADKLLGNGDMLFLVPGTSHIVRAQGTYVYHSAVDQAEPRGGNRRGRRERRDGGEAGGDQEFELAMDAQTVRRARVGDVRAGEDRDARGVELADGVARNGADRRVATAGEAELESLDVGRVDPGAEVGVGHQRSAAADSAHAVEDRQGGDDERFFRDGEVDEGRVDRHVGEDVDQAVGSFEQGLARRFAPRDVDDGELAPLVGRGDHRGEGLAVDRGPTEAEDLAVVVNDLDIIGPLGDPGVDERLRLGRPGDRGDLHAVLGPMPPRRGDERPARKQVRAARRRGRPHPGDERRVSEHIKLGRHAEDGSLFERFLGERVRMRVDQTRQQRLPRAVDDRRPRGDLGVGRDVLDHPVDRDHRLRPDRLPAVEDADLRKDDHVAGRRDRRRCKRERRCEQGEPAR